MFKPLSLTDCETINRTLEPLDARGRFEAILDRFGERALMFSSSFGAMSAALCHIVSEVAPGMDVYFLDTGFHFPETLVFRDALLERLNLTLKVLRPAVTQAELFHTLGHAPYRSNPDRCCEINKVEPLRNILKPDCLWISGLRRDQTAHRAGLNFINATSQKEAGWTYFKFHPILDWTARAQYEYIQRQGLPLHPLWEKGYASIGCAPCTTPCDNEGDERAGRWQGQVKTECGLHL